MVCDRCRDFSFVMGIRPVEVYSELTANREESLSDFKEYYTCYCDVRSLVKMLECAYSSGYFINHPTIESLRTDILNKVTSIVYEENNRNISKTLTNNLKEKFGLKDKK